jgi:hypothetical protein
MKKSGRHLAAAASALAVLALGGAAAAGGRPEANPVRLADATLIVEVNATDGDAGLQIFLDGEPWKAMQVTAPNGKTIVDVGTRGRLQGYGLTELFSESSEPPFSEFPLARFKQLFPEGRYTFTGETIEGRKLIGAARLSHDIPAGPRILEPARGARLGRQGVVARWAPVAEGSGVDIVGYRAIVTREDPLRVLNVDLPATATRTAIPAEFLEPGTTYKLEVQAIERSGNQTLTEIAFKVR